MGWRFNCIWESAHKGEEAEIAPALWQDNYIELMPGESREIRAQFLSAAAL